jgi:hypothetical protein
MTHDAHIPALPVSDAPRPAGPHVDRAERRLCTLEGLEALGVRITHSLARQTAPDREDALWPAPRIPFPYEIDPSAAYGRLSRAVRFSLAMEVGIEREIAAALAPTLAGQVVSRAIPSRAPPHPGELTAAVEQAMVEDLSARREKVRANVIHAIHQGLEESKRPEKLDDLNTVLREGEAYDHFIGLPLKEAVRIICGDLKVRPDWSAWTQDGFRGASARAASRRTADDPSESELRLISTDLIPSDRTRL